MKSQTIRTFVAATLLMIPAVAFARPNSAARPHTQVVRTHQPVIRTASTTTRH